MQALALAFLYDGTTLAATCNRNIGGLDIRARDEGNATNEH